MKFIHISDLHLGKKLHEYSLIEDQRYILNQIIGIIDSEKPDGVLIAGDVYDKSMPAVEAVSLFDDFLVKLSKRETDVFIISGNHDSAERVSFGARLMDSSGIHISPVYDGEIKPYKMRDEHGILNIYLLPFVKPAHVSRFTDEEIKSYTDAIRVAVEKMSVNTEERNVLVAHLFVTNSIRCESEEIPIGTLDNVDASVFEPFDYVALGHLHTPQNCGSEKIRYCGTPIKYSLSEMKSDKSVTVAELSEKGNLKVHSIPLTPLHELVELKGSYSEIMDNSFYSGKTWQDDYTHIILTDENEIFEAMRRLSSVYHRVITLDYDNTRTRSNKSIRSVEDIEKKSPLELFSELYKKQNNQDMSAEQLEYMKKLIEELREEEQQ